jgi:hypothetical protein
MADNDMVANVRGGALVGAGFGGIIGAVVGWILASTLVPVPVIGPVVGQGVLSTAIVAMVAGAAGGALLGALAGVFSRAGRRDYAPVPSVVEPASAAPLPIFPVMDAQVDAENPAFRPIATDIAPAVTDVPLAPTFEIAAEPDEGVPPSQQAAIEPQASAGTPVLRVRRRRQPPPDAENKPEE